MKDSTKSLSLILIASSLILSFVNCGGDENLYNLVLHSKARGALCLDGSPAGMYIHEGSGANRDNYLIYFRGGGFCEGLTLADTIQSCYKRSSTSLGTTKDLPAQKSFDGQGILSPKPEQNPVFHDWTKIFAVYCDGSEHQGHRENPITYKGQQLYFRGTQNSLEQFHYLDQKYDFYNGNNIVLTGVSAGGMATFQWSNYLMDHTKKAKVYAIPDSGFFIIDFYSEVVKTKPLKLYAQSLIALVGTHEEYLPEPIQKCSKKPGMELVDCYNTANYAEFLRAPMFIVQSPIDAYALQNAVAISCLKNKKSPYNLQGCSTEEMDAIEQYRQMSLEQIKNFKTRANVGIWGPACVQHGWTENYSFTNPNFKVSGEMVNEAISGFLKDPDHAQWHLEDQPWPSNRGCSGLSNGLNLQNNWDIFDE